MKNPAMQAGRKGVNGMEVVIKGEPKEIAALVLAEQGRQGNSVGNPTEIIHGAAQKAIDGIVAKAQDSSLQSSGT